MVETEQLLNAANGTSIKVMGKTILRCQANDYNTFDMPCFVSAQVSELILGLGWLEQQKAELNFGARWIKINNRIFPIYRQGRSGKWYRITAARDMNVATLCETGMEAVTALPDIKPPPEKIVEVRDDCEDITQSIATVEAEADLDDSVIGQNIKNEGREERTETDHEQLKDCPIAWSKLDTGNAERKQHLDRSLTLVERWNPSSHVAHSVKSLHTSTVCLLFLICECFQVSEVAQMTVSCDKQIVREEWVRSEIRSDIPEIAEVAGQDPRVQPWKAKGLCALGMLYLYLYLNTCYSAPNRFPIQRRSRLLRGRCNRGFTPKHMSNCE